MDVFNDGLGRSKLTSSQKAGQAIDLAREYITRASPRFTSKAKLPEGLGLLVTNLFRSDPIISETLGFGIRARHLSELFARFEQTLAHAPIAEQKVRSEKIRTRAYRILAAELLSNVLHSERGRNVEGWILPTLKHGALIYNLLRLPEISEVQGLAELVPTAAKRHAGDLGNFMLEVARTAKEVWAETEFTKFQSMPTAVFRLQLTDPQELRLRLRNANLICESVLESNTKFAIFRETADLARSVLRLAVTYENSIKLTERLNNSLVKLNHFRSRYGLECLSDIDILQVDLDNPLTAVSKLIRMSSLRSSK